METTIVGQIFEVISEAVTSFASALSSAVTSVTALFYSSSTGMTFLGVLLLIGIGCALIYFVIRWISGLVRRTA